jgi:hypothetical protein
MNSQPSKPTATNPMTAIAQIELMHRPSLPIQAFVLFGAPWRRKLLVSLGISNTRIKLSECNKG